MLDLYVRTELFHGNRKERMIYLKKTRRDAVGLLTLTSDSLEMLQICSVERR